MAAGTQCVAEQGVLTLPDAAWGKARQRMDVIGPLAALDLVDHQAADDEHRDSLICLLHEF